MLILAYNNSRRLAYNLGISFLNWQTLVTPEKEAELLAQAERLQSMVEGPDKEVLKTLELLPAHLKEDILLYWKELWGKPSEKGFPIYDIKLLADSLPWWKKERRKRGYPKLKQRKTELTLEQRIEEVKITNPEYAAWLDQCVQKRNYIAAKKQRWRELIAERNQMYDSYNASIEKIKNEIAEAEAWDLGKPPAKNTSVS
jgi:hypothetical protein